MDRYIHQLVEDLKESILIAPEREVFCDSYELDYEDEEDHMSLAFLENNLFGNQKLLSEIVEIDQMLLPPVDKLTSNHIEKVFPLLEELLELYGFELDFPEGVPLKLKYILVRDVWAEKFVQMNTGTQVIEFCDYDFNSCPFGSELCECKKFEERY
jgi:hypothetical protein